MHLYADFSARRSITFLFKIAFIVNCLIAVRTPKNSRDSSEKRPDDLYSLG